jgi:peptidoglycan/xylan/chitin deacetylase (PgdA/CDA1 family)
MPPAADAVVEKRGLELALWTTNVPDYRMTDPAEIASQVLAELDRRGGGVVLLHDTNPPTAEALPLVLDGIGPLNERRAISGLPPLRVVGPEALVTSRP